MPIFRRRELWIPLQLGQSGVVANNAYLNIRPFQNVNTTQLSIPSWVRSVELRGMMLAFTTNPLANSFQFSFSQYLTAANAGFGNASGSQAEVLTDVAATQNWNNGSNAFRYYLTSTYAHRFSQAEIDDAQLSGYYSCLMRIKNISGGSLTQTGDNWLGGMAVCY
jgi:hypothetical protein